MSRLSSQFSSSAAGIFVVRVTLANAFVLFPLIVMAGVGIWGPAYDLPQLKFFVYILAFSLLPIVGLGGYWLLRQSKSREGVASLLDLALTGPGMIAALLYLSPDGSWAAWDRIEFVALSACLAVLAGSALAFLVPTAWKDSCERVCRPAANLFWLASPLVVIVVSLWGQVGWLARLGVGDEAFKFGVLGGAACVAAVFAGPRLLASRSVATRVAGGLWLCACAVGAGAVLLRLGTEVGFSCAPSPWPQTYAHWVGPANAVADGGVPMVDAFSLYGLLSYLVYAGVFKFLLPPSYFAADAVTAFMNALAPALAIAICLKAARNRFLVLVAVPTIALALPWIVGINPANSGPRFSASMLLLLALAWLRLGRTRSWATLASMVFCAFWSGETLVWTLVTYTAFLAAVYLERRRALPECLASLALTLSCIVIAYSAFAATVRLVSGSWPRFDIYFGFMVRLTEFDYARIKPELGNPIWILQLGVCLAALAYALSAILWPGQMDSRRRWIALSVIFPGAALSACELSYWVSRPYYALFWEEAFPSIVSLILMLDVAISRGRGRASRLRLRDAPVLAALGAAFIILAVYDISWDLNGFGLGLSGKFQRYMSVFTGRPVARCIGERAFDAVALVEKYEPGRRSALFFMPGADDVSVALYSRHRQRLGYSYLWSDNVSRPLMQEVERRLGELVRPRDVLITMSYVYRQKGPVLDAQQLLDNDSSGASFVEKLGSRFQLCEVERTSHDVVAVRIMPKGEGTCAGVGKPFSYEMRDAQF